MRRIVLALFIFGGIPLAGHANVEQNANSAAASTTSATAVKIKDINTKPASFLNKSVRVRGEIQKKMGDSAFILNGEGVLNDEIMVIRRGSATTGANPNVATSSAMKIDEDDEVEVVGTVRRMTLADIRREYGLSFDPQIEVEFEGTLPVIVAENIQITDKD